MTKYIPTVGDELARLTAENMRLAATVERVQRLVDEWTDVLDKHGNIMTTAQRNAHDYDRLELLIALTGATPLSLEDFRATLPS